MYVVAETHGAVLVLVATKLYSPLSKANFIPHFQKLIEIVASGWLVGWLVAYLVVSNSHDGRPLVDNTSERNG